MKNLIVSVATNFNPVAIERFVLSFRQFNILDKILLIINQEDVKKHSDFIKKYKTDIEWYVVDDTYLFNKYYVITERFKYISKILKNIDCDKVFMVDVRDVVFQGNIFELENLTFFKEADIIENEPYNRFVVNHVNPKAFQVIKHLPIINAGTIYGPKDKIIDVCDSIYDHISKIPVVLNEVNNPFNFDQGYLNVAVHYSKFVGGDFDLSGNEDGYVNTIGLSCAYKNVDDNGFFINMNGVKSHVVHQFDRCSKDMIKQLIKRGLPVDDLVDQCN